MTIKHLFFLIVLVFFLRGGHAQTNSTENTETTPITSFKGLNDGPYVMVENNRLVQKNIVDGEVVVTNLKSGAYPLKFKPNETVFEDVDKIVALSDIHGQYDLALELLINNKVINPNLGWNFGTGHLVIVGDIFDRGTKVTELLWFIYELEKKAEASGGKIHFLLGNHEYMVLQNDLRFINRKYLATAQLLETPYNDLFGKETILGRWLRSKPTVLKIDDTVFVHGGISEDFLMTPFKINRINKAMRNYIDEDVNRIPDSDFERYFGNNGPIWYRGYFYDNLEESTIDNILKGIKSNHIIVGHCSNEEVVSLFHHKVFGVDSSIKKGENGELLFIENGRYSRGLKDGNRMAFE